MAHTLDAVGRFPDTTTTLSNANPVPANATINANATAFALSVIWNAAANRAGTPTLGGINMVQANAVQRAATSPEQSIEVWYLTDPPTGTVAISVPNANANTCKLVWASFIAGGAGANTSRYDTDNGANATSANGSVSVNTSANGCAIFSGMGCGLANCATGLTANTATLIYAMDLGAWGGGWQYDLQANAGVKAMGFTSASDDWCAVAVAFKEDIRDRGTVSQTLEAVTISANGTVETPAANPKFALSASANISANAATATTAQLTAPANKTSNNFGAAFISDDTNPLPSVNLTANQYTEVEWCIAATVNATNGQVYTFRVTANGANLDTYAANGTWTIGQTTSNGTVNQTLAVVTINANGTVAVNGAVSQTLAAVGQNATGTVAVTGVVAQTLGSLAQAITGTVDVVGRVSQTLEAVTPNATGTVAITADVTQTMESVTIDATGTVATSGEISGDVTQTLGSVTTEITGTVAVTAGVQQGLADATLSATATVAVVGNVGQTLGAVDIDATATVTTEGTISGEVSQVLGAVTVASTGTVAVTGAVTQTLGVVTPAVTGTVSVSGAVTQTLAAVSQSITGTTGGSVIAFVLSASTYIPANAASNTAGRLTPPAGKTVNADFQAGKISDDTNPLPSLDLVTNRYTELEWAVQATANAANTANYSFRVTANGTNLSNYAVTPTWQLLNAINGTVNQTLNTVLCNATAEQSSPGEAYAVVNQTLGVLGQAITGSTGRAAQVDVTLGSVSNPILHMEVTDLGGGAATGWHFYFGRVSGIYTEIVTYDFPTDYDVPLVEVAPDTGAWYVMVKLYNAYGESAASNEVFVVVPTFTVTVEDLSGIATVNQTLGSCTLAAVGKVAVAGTVTQTLAAVTRSITGTVSVSGTVAQTLGAVTRAITGAVDVTGTVSQPLGNVTVNATGAVAYNESQGTVDQTLESVTCSARAAVYETGSLIGWVDQLLDSVQCNMVGDVDVAALVDATLNPVGLAFTAHPGYRATGKRNVLLDGSEMRCS